MRKIIIAVFLLVISSGNLLGQQDTTVYKRVESMPRFPGCEDTGGSNEEKAMCAQDRMLQYISKNLKYPAIARESGVEGMTVIQFVVEKDGSVAGAKIVRDIGDGCGDAALKIVEAMNNMPQKWTPGMQRGRPVKVLYTLPIRFKLEGGEANKKREVDPNRSDARVVVFNNSNELGALYKMHIYFDSKKIASIKRGRYKAFSVNPGDLEIFVHIGKKKNGNSAVELQIEAGETVYLRIEDRSSSGKVLKNYRLVECTSTFAKGLIGQMKEVK